MNIEHEAPPLVRFPLREAHLIDRLSLFAGTHAEPPDCEVRV